MFPWAWTKNKKKSKFPVCNLTQFSVWLQFLYASDSLPIHIWSFFIRFFLFNHKGMSIIANISMNVIIRHYTLHIYMLLRAALVGSMNLDTYTLNRIDLIWFICTDWISGSIDFHLFASYANGEMIIFSLWLSSLS